MRDNEEEKMQQIPFPANLSANQNSETVLGSTDNQQQIQSNLHHTQHKHMRRVFKTSLNFMQTIRSFHFLCLIGFIVMCAVSLTVMRDCQLIVEENLNKNLKRIYLQMYMIQISDMVLILFAALGLFLDVFIKRLHEHFEKVYIYTFLTMMTIRIVQMVCLYFFSEDLLELKLDDAQHFQLEIGLQQHYLITVLQLIFGSISLFIIDSLLKENFVVDDD